MSEPQPNSGTTKLGGRPRRSLTNDSTAPSLSSTTTTSAATAATTSSTPTATLTPSQPLRVSGTCCFCSSAIDLSGECEVTWLGPFQVEGKSLLAHAACAKWNQEVKVGPDGETQQRDVIRAMKRIPESKCKVCGKLGGTIHCYASKCTNTYHIKCIRPSGGVLIGNYCAAYCKQHADKAQQHGGKDLIFQVERILRTRVRGNKRQYLIKWQGYDEPSDCTWEPAESFLRTDLIIAFEKEQATKADAKKAAKDKASVDRLNRIFDKHSTKITRQAAAASSTNGTASANKSDDEDENEMKVNSSDEEDDDAEDGHSVDSDEPTHSHAHSQSNGISAQATAAAASTTTPDSKRGRGRPPKSTDDSKKRKREGDDEVDPKAISTTITSPSSSLSGSKSLRSRGGGPLYEIPRFGRESKLTPDSTITAPTPSSTHTHTSTLTDTTKRDLSPASLRLRGGEHAIHPSHPTSTPAAPTGSSSATTSSQSKRKSLKEPPAKKVKLTNPSASINPTPNENDMTDVAPVESVPIVVKSVPSDTTPSTTNTKPVDEDEVMTDVELTATTSTTTTPSVKPATDSNQTTNSAAAPASVVSTTALPASNTTSPLVTASPSSESRPPPKGPISFSREVKRLTIFNELPQLNETPSLKPISLTKPDPTLAVNQAIQQLGDSNSNVRKIRDRTIQARQTNGASTSVGQTPPSRSSASSVTSNISVEPLNLTIEHQDQNVIKLKRINETSSSHPLLPPSAKATTATESTAATSVIESADDEKLSRSLLAPTSPTIPPTSASQSATVISINSVTPIRQLKASVPRSMYRNAASAEVDQDQSSYLACPLCDRVCLGPKGVMRHYIKKHPTAPRLDPRQLYDDFEKEMKEKQGTKPLPSVSSPISAAAARAAREIVNEFERYDDGASELKHSGGSGSRPSVKSSHHTAKEGGASVVTGSPQKSRHQPTQSHRPSIHVPSTDGSSRKPPSSARALSGSNYLLALATAAQKSDSNDAVESEATSTNPPPKSTAPPPSVTPAAAATIYPPRPPKSLNPLASFAHPTNTFAPDYSANPLAAFPSILTPSASNPTAAGVLPPFTPSEPIPDAVLDPQGYSNWYWFKGPGSRPGHPSLLTMYPDVFPPEEAGANANSSYPNKPLNPSSNMRLPSGALPTNMLKPYPDANTYCPDPYGTGYPPAPSVPIYPGYDSYNSSPPYLTYASPPNYDPYGYNQLPQNPYLPHSYLPPQSTSTNTYYMSPPIPPTDSYHPSPATMYMGTKTTATAPTNSKSTATASNPSSLPNAIPVGGGLFVIPPTLESQLVSELRKFDPPQFPTIATVATEANKKQTNANANTKTKSSESTDTASSLQSPNSTTKSTHTPKSKSKDIPAAAIATTTESSSPIVPPPSTATDSSVFGPVSLATTAQPINRLSAPISLQSNLPFPTQLPLATLIPVLPTPPPIQHPPSIAVPPARPVSPLSPMVSSSSLIGYSPFGAVNLPPTAQHPLGIKSNLPAETSSRQVAPTADKESLPEVKSSEEPDVEMTPAAAASNDPLPPTDAQSITPATSSSNELPSVESKSEPPPLTSSMEVLPQPSPMDSTTTTQLPSSSTSDSPAASSTPSSTQMIGAGSISLEVVSPKESTTTTIPEPNRSDEDEPTNPSKVNVEEPTTTGDEPTTTAASSTTVLPASSTLVATPSTTTAPPASVNSEMMLEVPAPRAGAAPTTQKLSPALEPLTEIAIDTLNW